MGPARTNPCRLPRYALCLAIGCELAILFGLYYYAERMRPAQPGNAQDFWLVTAWITPPDYEASLGDGGRFLSEENRYFYTRGTLSNLYEISRADVTSYWPIAEAQLEAKAADAERNGPVELAYRAWKDAGTRDINLLLGHITENRVAENEYRRNKEALYDYLLRKRVDGTRHYAANFVFEFVWLSLLAWLVFAPLFQRPSIIRGFVYWLIAPGFFFLPAYLGYALTALSSWGARGGVLYPHVLECTQGFRTWSSDRSILKLFPQFLAEFSQQAGPIPIDHVTGLWGPVSVIPVSLALGIGGAAIAQMRKRCTTPTSACLVANRDKHLRPDRSDGP